ncbi:hypothetical protein ATR1_075c0044, partial [Acetobacter tropicalis]|jgi:hypothetical protein
LGP